MWISQVLKGFFITVKSRFRTKSSIFKILSYGFVKVSTLGGLDDHDNHNDDEIKSIPLSVTMTKLSTERQKSWEFNGASNQLLILSQHSVNYGTFFGRIQHLIGNDFWVLKKVVQVVLLGD